MKYTKYRSIFWMVMPLVLILIAIQVGVVIFVAGSRGDEVEAVEEVALRQGSGQVEEGDEAKITAGAEVEKETEKEPAEGKVETKREDLKVQVLNGRGVAGTAGEAQDFLEELGYRDVEVGNADNFNFELTEIAIKDGKKDFVDQLRDDLSDEYEVSGGSSIVGGESEFDAVVTIGAK